MSGLAPLRNVQKPVVLRTPSGDLWKSKTFSTSTGSAVETEHMMTLVNGAWAALS